jgi:hypothetical protein
VAQPILALFVVVRCRYAPQGCVWTCFVRVLLEAFMKLDIVAGTGKDKTNPAAEADKKEEVACCSRRPSLEPF